MSSTIQYKLTTKFFMVDGWHSIAKFKATIFFPEKVVPRTIINRKRWWMFDVKRITPYAIVDRIMVTIKVGRRP